ncbi:MAG: hypothetical protein NTY38_21360 [Acidobacteria bacterium]|nr:hypothetical protein [Acidobacteriota bacterium]
MKLAIFGLCLAWVLPAADDAYLNWDAKYAAKIALSERASGQVGRSLDFRVLATDRSFNYKLRATWMTPSAIRAAARLEQFAGALSAAEAKKLVADAEGVPGTVVMIEIDPREGSGVIPLDWVATLGPIPTFGPPAHSVRGVNDSRLRDFPALAGGARRNYAYEVFWVVFPLKTDDGSPLFAPSDKEAELSVRIHDKIGRVRWKVPESARQ